MPERVSPCTSISLLHLELGKIKRKPAGLSGLTLADIFLWYDDGLDI